MPEHFHYEDDDLFNPETHHESSDVPIRPLWWAVIIFVVFAAVTHFVLAFMYKTMKEAEDKRMPPPQTKVTVPANATVPQNQPLLQPFPMEGISPVAKTPVTDLEEMRAAESARLHQYGWVDKQHGIVHIPIEEAKAKLVLSGAAGSQPAVPPAVPSAGPEATDQGGLRARPSTSTAAEAKP